MIRYRIINVVVILSFGFFLYFGCESKLPFHREENIEHKETVSDITELEEVKESTKIEIPDLSKAFEILLNKGSSEFFQNYPIDLSFLHWVNNCYGNEIVMDIAYRLYEGYHDPVLWYLETGNSMHVLWLEYCRDLSFSTYYLENVKFLENQQDVITIDFTGDINLADDWCTMEMADTKDNGIYDCISKEIVSELQKADLSVINHEYVLSDGGTPLRGKAYTFRGKKENVHLLHAFGADLANLANNHVYDYGEEGLVDTIAYLENLGITTMGAGKNLEEASAIHYYVANGKKIAIVSATEIEKFSNYTKEATETSAGVLKTVDPTIYCDVIRRAAKYSDYVIANVHWGVEGTYYYSKSQENLAKRFVEAGADVIIGGHPHRLQGIEYIDGKPCLYSLGNFWFSTGSLYTTIAQLQIGTDGSLALRLLPCIQQDVTTRMLQKEEEEAFYKFIADISKGIMIDSKGMIYNAKNDCDESFKAEPYYRSEMHYSSYSGRADLQGRPIDIVGNLK